MGDGSVTWNLFRSFANAGRGEGETRNEFRDPSRAIVADLPVVPYHRGMLG